MYPIKFTSTFFFKLSFQNYIEESLADNILNLCLKQTKKKNTSQSCLVRKLILYHIYFECEKRPSTLSVATIQYKRIDT